MNNEAVQVWLRLRRELLDMEAAFTSVAIGAANGQVSEALLGKERDALQAMREQCTAAYERAFPHSALAFGSAEPSSAPSGSGRERGGGAGPKTSRRDLKGADQGRGTRTDGSAASGGPRRA